MATPQVKVSVVLAPLSSVACTTTVYGPDFDADGSMTPEMTPVTASMLRPLGSPVAVKLSTSPALGSVKALATLSATVALSVLLCAGVCALTVGAWLAEVILNVCVVVPPWPSSAVTVTV